MRDEDILSHSLVLEFNREQTSKLKQMFSVFTVAVNGLKKFQGFKEPFIKSQGSPGSMLANRIESFFHVYYYYY